MSALIEKKIENLLFKLIQYQMLPAVFEVKENIVYFEEKIEKRFM